jgi:hypothetical protein
LTPGEEESAEERVRRYRRESIHYLQNAQEFLARQEFTKAGEFLWGGMAMAIKAVAAVNGISLRQHRELWDYTRELARELNAPDIFQDFRQANSLHSNFYESGLPPEEVIDSLSTLRVTIGKLLSLLPEEVSQD